MNELLGDVKNQLIPVIHNAFCNKDAFRGVTVIEFPRANIEMTYSHTQMGDVIITDMRFEAIIMPSDDFPEKARRFIIGNVERYPASTDYAWLSEHTDVVSDKIIHSTNFDCSWLYPYL